MKISISATDVLYHVTSIRSAADIVGKNRFELKPSDGTQAEEGVNLGYYLSMTRSKLGSYTLSQLGKFAAIFVLDGQALGHRHKIVQVDYWGTNGMTPAYRTKADEAEDRLLSKKPLLPARPYIKSVHAMVNEFAWQLKRTCLLHRVKVYFYSEENDLMLLDTRKAVQVSATIRPKVQAPYQHSREYREADFKRQRQNSIAGWIELYMVPLKTVVPDEIFKKSEALSEEGKRAYKILRYNYNGDPMHSLNADLHNAKSTRYGSMRGERESLDKIVALLRKEKLTVRAFVNKLYDKWYPT